jgi:hypothetical protein
MRPRPLADAEAVLQKGDMVVFVEGEKLANGHGASRHSAVQQVPFKDASKQEASLSGFGIAGIGHR